jgi:hypothetical protein
MTNEALAQIERLIADCKKRIERQREVVANGFQKGHDGHRYIDAARLRGKPQCLREAPAIHS